MSNISDFNTASNAETDREHEVQLGLLQALCTAARENQDKASLGVILDQLIAYSEAHFTSEELLMRMKSYDDYEDHVDDHNHMLEALQEIAADHEVVRALCQPQRRKHPRHPAAFQPRVEHPEGVVRR